MERDKNNPNTGNPAADDFLDWMVSPYGQLSSDKLKLTNSTNWWVSGLILTRG